MKSTSEDLSRTERPQGSGAWIWDFRMENGYTIHSLSRAIRRLGAQMKPGWPMTPSDTLIYMLENDPRCVTHPEIANLIAEALGATEAQRDSIVHKIHRGRWRRKKRVKLEPWKPPKLSKRTVPTIQPGTIVPIVMVTKGGSAIKRYPSATAAAADVGQNIEYVRKRCKRMLRDEFHQRDFTFRYAAEWDAMNSEQRLLDLAGPKLRQHEQEAIGKPVVAVNNRAVIMGTFKNAAAAAEAYQIGITTVFRRCNHRMKGQEFEAAGVTFRYLEEWEGMSQRDRDVSIARAR